MNSDIELTDNQPSSAKAWREVCAVGWLVVMLFAVERNCMADSAGVSCAGQEVRCEGVTTVV